MTIRREVITNSVNLSFCLTLTLTFDLPTIDYALCIIFKHILASFSYLICFKKFEFGRTFQGQGEGKYFGAAFHKLKYEPSLKPL